MRSDFFRTDNGVKQGGILSPILLCVYVDEVLKGTVCRISLAARMSTILSHSEVCWAKTIEI